jgi:cytoskeletal protein CcmA (bactofilin family)
MFFNKTEKAASRIDTLIGSETRIEGNIYFSGGLRVDGVIKGDVKEDPSELGTIVLSEHGQVEGAVVASRIMLNGKVVGPVHAKDYVELQPKARVTGDVYYKVIEMHTGAVIEGNLIYQGDQEMKLLTNKD